MCKKIVSLLLILIMLCGSGFIISAKTNLTNIAKNKTVTAGNWSKQYPKENIVDGKSNTYVNEQGSLTDNNSGVASDYTKGENWYMIDLGAIYPVDSVKLYDSAGNWSSEYDFKIKASVTKDFKEFDTLFTTTDFTAQSLPLEIPCNESYYRYILFERINSGLSMGYTYSELEVWADESRKHEEENEEGEPTNVALNKEITAGLWITGYEPQKLVDGNLKTFVYPNGKSTNNPDGIPSTSEEAWYIVDLGARHKIDYIKLIDDTNTWTGAYNIKVLASNDKNFEEGVYEIVNSGVDGKISLGENITCESNEYFRYVKIQKFKGSISAGFQYSEFEVYSSEELLINVNAQSSAENIVLTFNRDTVYNNPKDITLKLESTGETISFTYFEQDSCTLILTPKREVYGDAVYITFPEDFTEDIKLKTYELRVEYNNAISASDFKFTDGEGREIVSLTPGEDCGISVTLENNTLGTFGSCVVLTMLYKDNMLVAATEERVNLKAGESRTVEAKIQGKSGDSYRVWILRDYKSMSEILKSEIKSNV